MASAVIAGFQLPVELACWAAEELPMGGDEVHLTAHQLTPIHVTHGRPGHLDSLPFLFMRRDTRRGIVPALVLASSSSAQPPKP